LELAGGDGLQQEVSDVGFARVPGALEAIEADHVHTEGLRFQSVPDGGALVNDAHVRIARFEHSPQLRALRAARCLHHRNALVEQDFYDGGIVGGLQLRQNC